MDFSARVKVLDSVVVENVADGAILLDLAGSNYFAIDEVGFCIVNTLENSDSINAAYDQLLLEYDIEATSLKQEMLEYIEKLDALGLIEVISGDDRSNKPA
jgi:hypothetical protein